MTYVRNPPLSFSCLSPPSLRSHTCIYTCMIKFFSPILRFFGSQAVDYQPFGFHHTNIEQFNDSLSSCHHDPETRFCSCSDLFRDVSALFSCWDYSPPEPKAHCAQNRFVEEPSPLHRCVAVFLFIHPCMDWHNGWKLQIR